MKIEFQISHWSTLKLFKAEGYICKTKLSVYNRDIFTGPRTLLVIDFSF